jgi:hypothetical protein
MKFNVTILKNVTRIRYLNFNKDNKMLVEFIHLLKLHC